MTTRLNPASISGLALVSTFRSIRSSLCVTDNPDILYICWTVTIMLRILDRGGALPTLGDRQPRDVAWADRQPHRQVPLTAHNPTEEVQGLGFQSFVHVRSSHNVNGWSEISTIFGGCCIRLGSGFMGLAATWILANETECESDSTEPEESESNVEVKDEETSSSESESGSEMLCSHPQRLRNRDSEDGTYELWTMAIWNTQTHAPFQYIVCWILKYFRYQEKKDLLVTALHLKPQSVAEMSAHGLGLLEGECWSDQQQAVHIHWLVASAVGKLFVWKVR